MKLDGACIYHLWTWTIKLNQDYRTPPTIVPLHVVATIAGRSSSVVGLLIHALSCNLSPFGSPLIKRSGVFANACFSAAFLRSLHASASP